MWYVHLPRLPWPPLGSRDPGQTDYRMNAGRKDRRGLASRCRDVAASDDPRGRGTQNEGPGFFYRQALCLTLQMKLPTALRVVVHSSFFGNPNEFFQEAVREFFACCIISCLQKISGIILNLCNPIASFVPRDDPNLTLPLVYARRGKLNGKLARCD